MILTTPVIPIWVFTMPINLARNTGSVKSSILEPQLAAQIGKLTAQTSDVISNIDWLNIEHVGKNVAFIIIVASVALLLMLVLKIRELNKTTATLYGPNGASPRAHGLTTNAPPVNLPVGTVTTQSAVHFNDRWQNIVIQVNSYNEPAWKLAVIEADKYVDDALKRNGFNGETMGERLMLIKPGDLINLQELWDAHKLRNLLVHDANFQLKHSQALAAVNAFEAILKELGDIT